MFSISKFITVIFLFSASLNAHAFTLQEGNYGNQNEQCGYNIARTNSGYAISTINNPVSGFACESTLNADINCSENGVCETGILKVNQRFYRSWTYYGTKDFIFDLTNPTPTFTVQSTVTDCGVEPTDIACQLSHELWARNDGSYSFTNKDLSVPQFLFIEEAYYPSAYWTETSARGDVFYKAYSACKDAGYSKCEEVYTKVERGSSYGGLMKVRAAIKGIRN